MNLKPVLDRYAALLERLGTSVDEHPVPFSRQDDGSGHLEVDADGQVRVIITERGRTVGMKTFHDEDALLYHLVRGVTWMLAVEHEKQNRVEGQDVRRVIFAHDLDLMQRLSPEWAARRKAEIEDMLRRYPYHDDPAAVSAVDVPSVRPMPRWKVMLWRLVIFIVLMAAVGLAHLPLILMTNRQERLEKTGRRADAVVTARQVTKNRFADLYRLSYRFTADGREVSVDEDVSAAIYQRHREGGSIRVAHALDDPAEAMIVGNDRASRLAWIWGVIDTLLVVAAWRIWRSCRK